MTYEIILGRSKKDREKLGTRAAVYLGKHFVKMGAVTSFSNDIYMDVNTTHVLFVCGKRGAGKSYTMGVIAEGIADLPPETRKRLAVVILDTMGIYWTMRYPNHQDEILLKDWGMQGKGLDITIFTPQGFYHEYKEKGIPTDYPFAMKPSELTTQDWFTTFDLEANDPVAVFLERIILELKDSYADYSIQDIMKAMEQDTEETETIKKAGINRFRSAAQWGIFSEDATPLWEIVKAGRVSVLDVSAYATAPNGWKIKNLVIGLVSQKLFLQRMVSRKEEEAKSIESSVHYITSGDAAIADEPMVWLVIDEAHEFLPKSGKTTATDALVTLLREGRQPGISMILATQQPGKIHTDVMTQSDIFLSHHITARLDIEALGGLMQSYLRKGLDAELNDLPKEKGAAIVLDDINERLFPMKIRPRITWHGGSAPVVLREKKNLFSFRPTL